MDQPPKTVSVTLLFILLDAVIWLVFAIIVAAGGIRSFTAFSALRWVFAILALVSSAALFGTAFFLRRRKRLAFYFGLLLLTVIAALSVTDEFGLLDLILLLVNLIPLVLMLHERAWYLPPRIKV